MSINNHIKFKALVNEILMEEEKYHLTRTAIINTAKEVYKKGVGEGESIVKVLQDRLREVYKERRTDSIVDALINEKLISKEQKEYVRQLTMDEMERHLSTPHSGGYDELLPEDKRQIMEDVLTRLEAEAEHAIHPKHKKTEDISIDFKSQVEKAIHNIARRYSGGNYGGFFCKPSAMEKKMQRFCEQIGHFIASKECQTSHDLDSFITKNMARSGTFRKEWAKEHMPDIFKDISVDDAKREWENRRKSIRS